MTACTSFTACVANSVTANFVSAASVTLLAKG